MSNFNKALLAHFKAVYERAKFNLDNLDENHVGIGEHVDLIADGIKLVEQLANAKDCIELLDEFDGTNTLKYCCEEGL